MMILHRIHMRIQQRKEDGKEQVMKENAIETDSKNQDKKRESN